MTSLVYWGTWRDLVEDANLTRTPNGLCFQIHRGWLAGVMSATTLLDPRDGPHVTACHTIRCGHEAISKTDNPRWSLNLVSWSCRIPQLGIVLPARARYKTPNQGRKVLQFWAHNPHSLLECRYYQIDVSLLLYNVRSWPILRTIYDFWKLLQGDFGLRGGESHYSNLGFIDLNVSSVPQGTRRESVLGKTISRSCRRVDYNTVS